MDVPAFYRWLLKKCPSVVLKVSAKLEHADPSAPNPNGIEFDNLYLDMNGIIHSCTHPEDKPAPADEDEMMVAIFDAIDRMLNIVRPRKILYMAIDGVAPRAKMNQQKCRRFRATKETSEKIIEVNKIREKLLAEGAILPPAKEAGSHFDSNCITPGTPFMDRLSKCLHYYAHNKLNNDPAWKYLKIILSDANVPGEGEHKIMDFIRKQRAHPNHDPNTVHCLCGADADLIMLGLATHEPHFYIIREEFKTNMDRPCDICGRNGHEMKNCTGLERNEEIIKVYSSEVQFIFVRLAVLREYLKSELEMPELPFTYDFERAIDDWVFMCFFVGNDFLPHLPSLEIREGAIDRLVELYKKAVYKTGGYLTENGQAALNRVQVIMSELGVVEDEIFKNRQQREEMFRAKKRRMRNMNSRDRPTHILSGQYAPSALGGNVPAIINPRQEAFQLRVQSYHTQPNANPAYQQNAPDRGVKRPALNDQSGEEEPVNDEVRLWESGFKDRYYESKFDVSKENLGFRQKVALEYIRGLCWVLHYYYQGCPCWKWYFPYHYAPFASDFIEIASFPVVFEKGTQPFNPLEQLMSVFPAASKQHVPEPWSTLMFDPFSPIIDFYPEDFKIDLNGKKFAWQGVALLPFVDEERLHKALAPLYPKLTDEERRRNTRGDSILYVSQHHISFTFIRGLYDNKSNFEMEVSLDSNGMLGRGLLATNCVNCGGSLTSPVRGLQVIRDNQVLCVRFRDPAYAEGHIFSTKRLPGATDPFRRTESKTPQSKESSFITSRVSEQSVPMSSESQSASSTSPPNPTNGRGRGEMFKNLKPMKAPEFQPTVMVGRLPLTSEQFVSLITPPPCGSEGLGENNSDLSQSSSSSRRRRGRGELLNLLSMKSSDSQSMKSATSNESLTDKLSQQKLETTPVPIPRGRGALITRALNALTNLAKLKAADSTAPSANPTDLKEQFDCYLGPNGLPATAQKSVSRVIHYPVIEEQDGTTKGILKPRIYWYQDLEFVYMHISLNVDEHVVRFESDKLYFRASDNGKLYEFKESLYTMIDESTAKSYKSGVQIVIKMEKLIKRNRWPRLFKNKDTTRWVRKSFDHLDEDLEVPDAGWNERLNTGLALQELEEFPIINYTNYTIYPEGYQDSEADSEDEDDLEADSEDEDAYDSEEEWVFVDEPQTLAASVQKVEKSYVPEDKDSEEDLYNYENDSTLSNDLKEQFEQDKMQSSNNNTAPKIHRSAIQLPTNNELPLINSKPATAQKSVSRVIHYPIIEDKRILKPRIYWYQDMEFVYMHISLNVDEHVVRFESDKLYFRASDNGKLYEFKESLYTMIDESTAKSYKSGVQIVIKMEKLIKRNRWPRLFKDKDTTRWVRKSFDHLDEDLEVPDAGWNERLNTGLALQELEEFPIINDTNYTIYPEGYEDYEDSEADSEDEDLEIDSDDEAAFELEEERLLQLLHLGKL